MPIVSKDTPHGVRYLSPNGKTYRWVTRREDATTFRDSLARQLAKQLKGKIEQQ